MMKSATAHALADAIVEATARHAREHPPSASEVESATVETLSGLRQRTLSALRVAELDGDFGAIGSMGRLLVAIAEHERKIAPPPPVDPNELPDLVAAAEKTKARVRAWLARRGAA